MEACSIPEYSLVAVGMLHGPMSKSMLRQLGGPWLLAAEMDEDQADGRPIQT